MKNGQIHYKFGLKALQFDPFSITKPTVTDGKWHNIILNVSDKSVFLTLDQYQSKQNFAVAPHRFYSVNTDVLSVAGTQTPRIIDGVKLTTFQGCLKKISLNGENLPIKSSDKFNVTAIGPMANSCTGSDVCASNPCTDPSASYCVDEWEAYKCVAPGQCGKKPCRNNGICIPTANGYTCNCRGNFTGTVCETPIICLTSPCKSNENCVADSQFVYKCVAKTTTIVSPTPSTVTIVIIVVVTAVSLALIVFIVFLLRKRHMKRLKSFDGDFNDNGREIEMKHTGKSKMIEDETELNIAVQKGSRRSSPESMQFENQGYVDDSWQPDLNIISKRNAEIHSRSNPTFNQPRAYGDNGKIKDSNRSLPALSYQDDIHLERRRNERILHDLRGLSAHASKYEDRFIPGFNETEVKDALRRSHERLKKYPSNAKINIGTATPPFESGFESTGSDMDSEREQASVTDIVDNASQLELYDLEVASIGFSEMSWQNDNNSASSRDTRRDYIDKRLDRLRQLVPQFHVYDHASTISDRNTKSDDRLSDLIEQESSSDSDGSFTGSEYEYGDERISTNKLKRKHLVFSKHQHSSDSEPDSSFVPMRRKNSLDSSVTSMTEVGSTQPVSLAGKGNQNGSAAIPPIDWDELLNWAMKYENLADVYRDLAALDDTVEPVPRHLTVTYGSDESVHRPSRLTAARSSDRIRREQDLLEKPVKFHSVQELHSEEYV